jgi:hypothetical protein
MSLASRVRGAWRGAAERRRERRATAPERQAKRAEAKGHHRKLKSFDEGRGAGDGPLGGGGV